MKNNEPEEALAIMHSLGRSSPRFGLLQPILLGSKTLGACRCPESLTARLIPASGRGQMCQSLLGLAAFSPPGSQCRRIQLRYNNLTPLKQLDPLAWQPLLCFMPLRTSSAIKNYSQQHLNCSSIHFGAHPLRTPFSLPHLSLFLFRISRTFVARLLSYQFFSARSPTE